MFKVILTLPIRPFGLVELFKAQIFTQSSASVLTVSATLDSRLSGSPKPQSLTTRLDPVRSFLQGGWKDIPSTPEREEQHWELLLMMLQPRPHAPAALERTARAENTAVKQPDTPEIRLLQSVPLWSEWRH